MSEMQLLIGIILYSLGIFIHFVWISEITFEMKRENPENEKMSEIVGVLCSMVISFVWPISLSLKIFFKTRKLIKKLKGN